jgi:membrane protease YdiL (CAAX protease family)
MNPSLTPGPEEGAGDAPADESLSTGDQPPPPAPETAGGELPEIPDLLVQTERAPSPYPLGLTLLLVAATYISAMMGTGFATLVFYLPSRGRVQLLLVSLLIGHILGIWAGVRSLNLLRRVARRTPEELGISVEGDLVEKVRQGIGIYFMSLPGYLFFTLLLTTLTEYYGVKVEQKTVQEMVKQVMGNPGAIVLFFLLAAVAAPVWEELIFRGLLYPAVRARWGMWAGMLGTGFLFAMMHETGQVLHDPRTFLFPIFYLGCVLAYVRDRTGSVVPGMVVHALHNTVALAVSLLYRQQI